jgi:perosamine synthetase
MIKSKLAIYGGKPIRKNMLNYGKQTIDELDKQAVLEVLNENKYLTTGPKVSEFENKVKEYCGAKYACAVNSGTAALHLAIHALDLKSSDEVIVTCLSFVASSNAILYCGVKPVFCDIEADTMNIDPDKIEKLITKNTKAILVVDFAGQPCDYHKILPIVKKHNLVLIEDAAHSIGCQVNSCPNKPKVGSFADITTFSFHPVKNITTCEGGMAVTNNKQYYNRMKSFLTHGITRDYKDREKSASHYYEMVDLGYNYRIPDLLCALGISQLNKIDSFILRRQEIAKIYDQKLRIFDKYLVPLTQRYESAYHIYVIKLKLENLKWNRDQIFEALHKEGIGVNVHYMPIHLHPYYKNNLNTYEGMMPIAEKVYKQIITLPLFPLMTNKDIDDVVQAITKIINYIKFS